MEESLSPELSDLHRQVGGTGVDASLNFRIEGMHCASCVSRIEESIRKSTETDNANVNLATGLATVSFRDNVQIVEIINSVEKLGYNITRENMELEISNMHCASCIQKIEKSINQVPGVLFADANLVSKKVRVEFLSGGTSAKDVFDAVSRIGYTPVQTDSFNESAKTTEVSLRESQKLKQSFLLALVFALPVFLLEMTGHIFPMVGNFINQTIGESVNYRIQFALTTLLLAWPGAILIIRGLKSLRFLAPDMNSLVAIGALSAWGYSVVSTFMPNILPANAVNNYYESAAMIVTFILLGRYFEERAKGKASDSIRKLIDLTPQTAHLIKNGKEVETLASLVNQGDQVRIKPGEKVPVDGLVVEGTTYIDESLISGEPIPVAKESGAKVTGGTINQSGSILIKATNVGADSTIARIVRLVEEAQSSKLPVQKLVDRITAWFVPAIIIVAALTFAIWMIASPTTSVDIALVNSVAVLIIACPCAMGLATPISIIVGTGRGAAMGMLFRKGSGLEQLRRVSVIAFDKTGTLTEGHPSLDSVIPVNGFTAEEVLTYASAIESRSEHPIAKAIVSESLNRNVESKEVLDFKMETGRGVSGVVEGKTVKVGTEQFVAEGINAPDSLKEEFSARAFKGQTVFYVSIDAQVAGMIAVVDPIKKGASEAISAVKRRGISTVMLTGDDIKTAQSVGQTLGIDEVRAQLLPEDKILQMKKIKKDGTKVAFVGDGINDAPALSEADVGIAIGSGTDIAIESADLVLMSNELRIVAVAVDLSRATIRNISTNLFWAFAYNICLIPVAAGILYPSHGILFSPMLAAIAMALSSIFVVLNALRLRNFKAVA